MKNKWKLYLLAGVLAVSVLSGCAAGGAAPESNKTTEDNETAKSDGRTGSDSAQEAEESDISAPITFEAQDMDGNTVSADVFSNAKLTMVNVWATYCNPCLSEMPELGELAKEYDESDFQIIGIISDVLEGAEQESVELAAYLIEQTGADYPHLLINESLYYALLTEVSAVPTTFFIDNNGTILDTVVGAQDKAGWKEQIDALLEEQ